MTHTHPRSVSFSSDDASIYEEYFKKYIFLEDAQGIRNAVRVITRMTMTHRMSSAVERVKMLTWILASTHCIRVKVIFLTNTYRYAATVFSVYTVMDTLKLALNF